MKTVETIKKLSDKQIEIAFITLGVYFSKNHKINKQPNEFKSLSKEGIRVLNSEEIIFNDELNVCNLKDLLKIEMFKRGIS